MGTLWLAGGSPPQRGSPAVGPGSVHTLLLLQGEKESVAKLGTLAQTHPTQLGRRDERDEINN